MNTRYLVLCSVPALVLATGCATSTAGTSPGEPPAPVPVVTSSAPARPAPAPAMASENQRLYGPASPTIIPAGVAKSVIDKFRAAYSPPGAPRIVIHVNRALVDMDSGLKLSGRTEKYSTTRTAANSDMETPAAAAPQSQVNVAVGGGNAGAASLPTGRGTASTETTTTSGENTYTLKAAPAATLADQQTVREVERLFGRVFRAAGAQLADQKIGVAFIADQPGQLTGTTDQSAKDREALGQIADIAIEVLISSRQLTVPTVAGDETLAMPDIQATAIRLNDAAILGQASASDILGQDRQAGHLLKQYDIRDITEATALALMEDMLLGK